MVLHRRSCSEAPGEGVTPIADEEQEEIIQSFVKQQENSEKFFASLLFVIASPIFGFFLYHSYYQILDPWQWPFEGLRSSDILGSHLASLAHLLAAICMLSSCLSTSAQKMPYIKTIFLRTAIGSAALASILWIRVCSVVHPFPLDYFLALIGALMIVLNVQWIINRTYLDTREEIDRLTGLKYRFKTI